MTSTTGTSVNPDRDHAPDRTGSPETAEQARSARHSGSGTRSNKLSEPGRRELKAARTRSGIEAAALRLFREQGFEATTVEQIAAEADVAPRTFFRYFPSKDAVLFGDLGSELDRMRAALRESPTGNHPMRTLAGSMLETAAEMEPEREQHLLRAELMHALETAGSYELHLMRQRWMQDVTSLLAEHLEVESGTDPRPGAWSMTLVSCFGSAMHAWLLRTGGTSLREILTDVLAGTAAGLCRAADEADGQQNPLSAP